MKPEHFLSHWQDAFNRQDIEALVRTYDPQRGTLWGTFSTTLRQDSNAIRDYFATVFTKEQPRIVLHPAHTRQWENSAACSGRFTFSWTENGQSKSAQGRYSFTLRLHNGVWTIVDHHSSVMPDLPAPDAQ